MTTTPNEKPPVPNSPFTDWPRIHVDTSEGSPVARLLRTAGHAANRWTLGPDGPYRRSMTGAEAHEGHLREGLLHLLELGLLDIDTERLDAAKGLPCQRATNPPAAGADGDESTRPDDPFTGWVTTAPAAEADEQVCAFRNPHEPHTNEPGTADEWQCPGVPPTAPEPCPPGCVACATDESHDPVRPDNTGA